MNSLQVIVSSLSQTYFLTIFYLGDPPTLDAPPSTQTLNVIYVQSQTDGAFYNFKETFQNYYNSDIMLPADIEYSQSSFEIYLRRQSEKCTESIDSFYSKLKSSSVGLSDI